jgi:hypothetical protein
MFRAFRDVLVLVSVLCMLGAPAVEAQTDCTTQPGNAVINCGFDTDLIYWAALVADSLTHTSGDGDFANGAAVLDALENGPGDFTARMWNTGLAGAPLSDQYEAGVAVRLTGGGSGSTECQVTVFWMDTDSNILDFDTGPWFPIGGAWSRWGWPFGDTPGGGLYSQFSIRCDDSVDFTVAVDDTVVGSDWIPVELQSFSVE